MDRRNFMKIIGSGALAFALPGALKTALAAADTPAGGATSAAKPLNFVFFLIDDLGWADVGCNNPKTFYETPNVNQLAREGMRFSNAYAACPVCSPTRASIMTGKYPQRVGITDWIPGENRAGKLKTVPNANQLPLEEETIGEALKAAGYKTGFVGKWHLGKEEYYPDKQGFDTNLGGCDWGQPKKGYFAPWGIPSLPEGQKGEYLNDRLTICAEEFMAKNKNNPFFLYFAHYAVHTPIQGKPELVEKYKAKNEKTTRDPDTRFAPEHDKQNREFQDHATYAAMVESMDHSVGNVMKKIKDLGIEDRTVVIFMSDNGGLSTTKNAPTSNRPLRAGKGWLYEGGIREPLIVKWPGVTKPGSVCDEVVTSTDFYPTLLEMAGQPLKPKQHLDGLSLAPLLRGTAKALDRKGIYWHYPHYHGSGHRPSGAVRAGDWKLIEFYEDMHVELYNLKEDIAEKKELAAKSPQKADELRKMLHDWRKQVGAIMPEPNPNFSPKGA